MSEAVFAARDVHFAYGAEPVLQGIDISVAGGEIVGLVGADGAGKTTLMQIAVGQLEADSGTVTLLGKIPSDPQLRDDIAYMPQGFGLYQDLSVIENLHFFADLHGLPRATAQQRIRDLLTRTGLTGFEIRRAGQLSGGMMQKLALSCALLSEPRMMFLDEPTTGVDPVSRRAFWQLLDRVRAEGMSIMYATANMDEAERCDRVAMLQDGRMQRHGTPAELAAPGNMQLLVVSGKAVRDYRKRLRRLPAVQLVFAVGPRLHVWLAADSDIHAFTDDVERLSAELHVEPAAPSLNDTALRDLAMREFSDDRHDA